MPIYSRRMLNRSTLGPSVEFPAKVVAIIVRDPDLHPQAILSLPELLVVLFDPAMSRLLGPEQ